MKTKLFFYLAFAMFIPNILIGQTEEFICGTPEVNDDIQLNSSPFSHSIDPEYLYSLEPKVLNVFFW